MSDASATLWTVSHQAPLSMGFSRQEYWNGLPCPPPGHPPHPGFKPVYPKLAGGVFTTEPAGKPRDAQYPHFKVVNRGTEGYREPAQSQLVLTHVCAPTAHTCPGSHGHSPGHTLPPSPEQDTWSRDIWSCRWRPKLKQRDVTWSPEDRQD